jgi:hypothetical protein
MEVESFAQFDPRKRDRYNLSFSLLTRREPFFVELLLFPP